MSDPTIVPAHTGIQTIHISIHYPDHNTRESDPNYHLFDQTKKRLQESGLYKCVVCGSTEKLELHHSHIEFSMINAVDIEKLNEMLGLHLDNESYQLFVQSPNNLEILCLFHHRGAEGIHLLSQPIWEIVRIQRSDLPDIAEARGNI